jgi:CDP-alcohol phosphatidyltransferase.
MLVQCILGRSDNFVVLFVLSGLSDMLDGFLARRFGWCTEFGATLDSLSDLALYISTMIFLCRFAGTDVAKCAVFVALGLLVQLIHIAISVKRHGQFPAYHTLFSKIAGYICFAGILAFWAIRVHEILIGLVFVWLTCSFEGLIITYILKKPMRDLMGIRHAMKVSA